MCKKVGICQKSYTYTYFFTWNCVRMYYGQFPTKDCSNLRFLIQDLGVQDSRHLPCGGLESQTTNLRFELFLGGILLGM